MKKACILLAFMLALQLFPAAAVTVEDSQTLFFEDFEEKNAEAWEAGSGEPLFEEEEETQNTVYSVGAGDYFEKETMSNLRNYSFSFDVFMDYRDANGQFGTTWPTIRFRMNDGNYYHMYLYNKEGQEEVGFQKMVDGSEYWLATVSIPLVQDNETWVPMKFVLTGSKIEVFYKDMEKPIISYDDANGEAPVGGSFYFAANSATKFYIDNLKVSRTSPEQDAAENVQKDTTREVYKYYDYETESGENIVEDTDGNHFLDIPETGLLLGEYQDFICRLNQKNDYMPYGENLPVFSFGGGYEVEFDSTLANSGIVLKKDGAELARESIILADYDNVWATIGFSAIGNMIEVYYGDSDTPILTYNTDEIVPKGEIALSGGDVDNLCLTSAYRFRDVEIISAQSELSESQMSILVEAVSHAEADITATVIAAGYKDGNLCALAPVQTIITGNDCNAAEKTATEIPIDVSYVDGAEYYVYIWDGMKPLSDIALVDGEQSRTAMPAKDEIMPTLSLDAQSKDNKISIMGKLEDDLEQSITLLVQSASFDEADISKAVYLVQLAAPEEDGSFAAEFDASSLEEGDYTVFAACDDAEITQTQVEHIKPENLDSFIESVNSAATAEELRVLLTDSANFRYTRYFGIDSKKLASLSETLQNGVCMRMLAQKGDGFTKDNIGSIFSPHLAFAMLKTASDAAGIYSLITENAELYPFDGEAGELFRAADDEIKLEALSGIFEGLKANNYNDMAGVTDDLEAHVLLATIYLSNYKEIPSLLELYEDKLGIDIKELDDLTATQISKVCKELNESRLYSYEEFAKKYEKAIREQTEEAEEPRPSGGGGGGGGGTRITVQPAPVPTAQPKPTAEPEPEKEKISYPDLPQKHWANEAVAFLSEQEPPVISGYEDGHFYPDKKVTRAEFVKLIINAFKFTEEASECSYTDVAQQSWYYSYIATAQKAGIVTGTDDGRFEPDAEISRQDMAVMLYRVLEIKLISLEAAREPAFPDGDTVSVYAQKAVQALGAAGVINGSDGGKLNPFASATRAQAAKMIYEILK